MWLVLSLTSSFKVNFINYFEIVAVYVNFDPFLLLYLVPFL